MTVEQRLSRIKELAGDDLHVVMNVEVSGVLHVKDSSKSLIHNNAFNSANVSLGAANDPVAN